MTCDSWLVTHDLWISTCDLWLMTCDMWLMTDKWFVTCDCWPFTCEMNHDTPSAGSWLVTCNPSLRTGVYLCCITGLYLSNNNRLIWSKESAIQELDHSLPNCLVELPCPVDNISQRQASHVVVFSTVFCIFAWSVEINKFYSVLSLLLILWKSRQNNPSNILEQKCPDADNENSPHIRSYTLSVILNVRKKMLIRHFIRAWSVHTFSSH